MVDSLEVRVTLSRGPRPTVLDVKVVTSDLTWVQVSDYPGSIPSLAEAVKLGMERVEHIAASSGAWELQHYAQPTVTVHRSRFQAGGIPRRDRTSAFFSRLFPLGPPAGVDESVSYIEVSGLPLVGDVIRLERRDVSYPLLRVFHASEKLGVRPHSIPGFSQSFLPLRQLPQTGFKVTRILRRETKPLETPPDSKE